MIVVNIEVYGDFDIPTTAALMVAPEGMNKGTVKNICHEARTLLANTRNEKEAIQMLKTAGFAMVQSCNLLIGDNL